MTQINTEKDSLRSMRKTKKRRKFLRYSLVIFVLFILGAAGVVASEFHRLNPLNHFNHLKVIGTTSTAISGYKEKSGVFNVLLIGSDARKTDPAGHTDSILLVHADLNNHRYDVMSLPRDSRVYMPGIGYTKLTSVQYISQIQHGSKQGVVDAINSISNLTGVPINYYAETNYWGFQDMVNAIGGIEMDVPFNVTLTHPWYKKNKNKVITAGTQSLDGEMVTEIVHERDSVPGTDFGRQELQERALIGIAKKIMQPANITKLPALSRSASSFLVATNMTTDDFVSIGLGVKSDFHPQQQIKYHQLKGKSMVMYDDVLKRDNDEVVLDPVKLKEVVQKYFTN
ncbi:LCP family protein [Heyndrickxia acidicola]|uniref:LCP family protein n=1 Tax=Heyndrickxia acidicola TaxID=209389 RepID=A0ABU6MGL5_9BACI|nr:LCP family protein [Heyndrickxia acidicola]MED1203553.1 LCP family protein [Heyndrickxia acidicola]